MNMAMTNDEQKCENHFLSSHKRDADGRFLVKLPFKDEQLIPGDSTKGAISRFYSFERRFRKDPRFHKHTKKLLMSICT